MLILADGVQEYLRWEGPASGPGTKILNLPIIEVSTEHGIALIIQYNLGSSGENPFFLEQMKVIAKSQNETVENVTDAATFICRQFSKDLESKINLEENFNLYIRFIFNGNEIVKMKVGNC